MTAYQQLDVDIRVGKKGITPGVIAQIQDFIKRKGQVKVKMLQTHTEGGTKKELAEDLAKQSASKLVWRVGGVLVLKK